MKSSPVKLTRKQLYDEVWRTPTRLLAEKYGLSDVGLAKACRRMGIPRPPRGYWRRKETGAEVDAVPLPLPEDGHQLEIEFFAEVRPRRRAPSPRTLISPEFLESFDEPHPLVSLTSDRLAKASVGKTGILSSSSQRRLDLAVTPGSLERGLRIFDVFLKAWEAKGNEVRLETGAERKTLLYSEGETLRISIEEAVEEVELPPIEEEFLRPKWTWKRRTAFRGTGVLTLLLIGDAVETRKQFRRRFRDSPSSLIEARINRILASASDYAAERKHHLAEAERRRLEFLERERRWEKERRRSEEAMRRRMVEEKRVKEFLAAAENWDRAIRLREFVTACRERMIQSGVDAVAIDEWVTWAEKTIRGIDPLNGEFTRNLRGFLEGGNAT